MPLFTTLAALSQTPASNAPDGSVDAPSTIDDQLCLLGSFIAKLRDGKGLSPEADVASAAACDIGGANTYFVRITGTTTITSFGTNYNGPRFIRFAGALTLAHNASTLILPGGANITTVAGDTCIAIPISAGWVVYGYQRATATPAFSAYQSVAQSFPNLTFTKVQLQAEEFDTANAFDSTTNYRFTPQVPGYYQITGSIGFSAGPSLSVAIYKNGAIAKKGTNGTAFQAVVSALLFLNGTTDYVELFAGQISGGSQASVSDLVNTYFQGYLARPA